MVSYPNTRATSPSPTEPISPSPGWKLNDSAPKSPPGVPAFANTRSFVDPMFTWPYPPSQCDHRPWTAGYPRGDPCCHSFWGAQGPAFSTYPEIPPGMMNPGYAAIPNLQPDVFLPSNSSVEGFDAPPPETRIHKEMPPTKRQPEMSHSDRRSDPQQASRPIKFKCRWDGCTYPGTFAVGTSLWRNIQAHIGPDWFKCPAPGCNRTFDLGRKDKYNAHIRLVHRDRASNLLEPPSPMARA